MRHARPLPLLLLLAVAAAVVSVCSASTAKASLAVESPAHALAIINAERQANGIPPLNENVQWSQGCAEYVRYLNLNPSAFGTDAHHEKPGNPGYTDAGALAAASSLLTEGNTWFGTNPWESAPLHLASILSPLTKQIGVAAAGGYSCLAIEANQSSPGANVFFTYPGPGRTNVPTWEDTLDEVPNPTEILNLTEDTGPFLFVYGDGAWTRDSYHSFVVSQASLTAADGTAVALTVVDQNTPALNIYVPVAAAMLVPIHPLAAKTTYTASVTVTSMGVTLSHTWSFTTGAATSDPNVPPTGPIVPSGGKLTQLTLSRSSLTRSQVASTTAAFTLNGASSDVQFMLTEKTLGYHAVGRCLAPSYRAFYPNAPRCTVWAELKQFTLTSRHGVGGGPHTLSLSRLVPNGFAVGSYRLTVWADAGRATVAFSVRP
jgi:hypothetical protein